MVLILLGPPGCGKGTQGEKISSLAGIKTISTGEIFRAAISSKTPMGIEANKYIEKGELVPDEVVIGIVREELSKEENQKGFILDGFPRTIPQADALNNIIDDIGLKIDHVISMEVIDDVIVKRISGRRACKECNEGYHIEFLKPEKEGICDKCGSELFQRDDDKEETVKNRLEVYYRQTEPLISYYREKSLLTTIDAMNTVEEIFNLIKNIIGI